MDSLFLRTKRQLAQTVVAGRYLRDDLTRTLSGQPTLSPPYANGTLGPEEDAIAARWLRAGTFDAPQITAQYARTAALVLESSQAFPFMSGRESLSAILEAMHLEPGDEVVVPAFTCVVVPNAVRFAGLNVVYCDIELDTYSLSIDALQSVIGPKTRVVLLQHLFGLVARDSQAIAALAKERGLYLIEDCAHAAAARFADGSCVGSLGDAAFFSSEQSKTWSTIQGGIAVARNPAIEGHLKRIHDGAPEPCETTVRKLLSSVRLKFRRDAHPHRRWTRLYAQLRWGHNELISTTAAEMAGEKPVAYGRRMPAPLAEIGNAQMQKLPSINLMRQRSAGHWDAWCQSQGYQPPHVVKGSVPIYLRYPVMVDPELKTHPERFRAEWGVELGMWFTSKTHPVNHDIGPFPNADRAVAGLVNLPTIGLSPRHISVTGGPYLRSG